MTAKGDLCIGDLNICRLIFRKLLSFTITILKYGLPILYKKIIRRQGYQFL